jgi:co-chaperonin GroES (HSP10)
VLQPLGKRIIVRDRKVTQEGAIIRPEHVNPAWLEGEVLAVGWLPAPDKLPERVMPTDFEQALEYQRMDRVAVGQVVLFSFRAGIVVERTMGDKVRFLMVEEVMAVVATP